MQKGDVVRYCGEEYLVFQVFKRSDMVVLKSDHGMVYTWYWKCRMIKEASDEA